MSGIECTEIKVLQCKVKTLPFFDMEHTKRFVGQQTEQNQLQQLLRPVEIEMLESIKKSEIRM